MVIKTPVHYSTDETVPVCGVKSPNVSHYLGEVTCLRCTLMLRDLGLSVSVKKGRRKRGQQGKSAIEQGLSGGA